MNTPVPVEQQLTPQGGWRTPGRVRLQPLTPAETPPVLRFLMLMRNSRLFRSWLGFASKMMPYGKIERRDTELVILRVGWNCRARYEWGQHVDIGLRAGLLPQDIARVPQGAGAQGWEPRVAALLQACDEFHADRMIEEQTWNALSQHFDAARLLEVVMLIGHYEMLAGVLNSTGLPLDTRLEDVLGRAPIHGQR